VIVPQALAPYAKIPDTASLLGIFCRDGIKSKVNQQLAHILLLSWHKGMNTEIRKSLPFLSATRERVTA
jgi:hypothetical protein